MGKTKTIEIGSVVACEDCMRYAAFVSSRSTKVYCVAHAKRLTKPSQKRLLRIYSVEDGKLNSRGLSLIQVAEIFGMEFIPCDTDPKFKILVDCLDHTQVVTTGRARWMWEYFRGQGYIL